MIDSDFDFNNDPAFKKFLDERNIKTATQNNYRYHLRYYCQLINKTPKELIQDAKKEEEDGIKMRKRKIRRYLERCQSHYEDRGFSPAHIKIGISMIRSFYKFFEIDLPKPQHQQYEIVESRDNEDLLTIEEIQKALEIVSPTYKAIILLMVSSGMGRAEIISLTVQDFINSISNYFDKPITLPLDIGWIRKKLERINAPIATWNIRRIKTSGKFTTFSTPESIFAILNYLEEHPPESMDRKLFIPRSYSKGGKLELNPSAFSYTFQRINNKCGFPQVGRMGKFRSHNLRKFFASQMMKTSLSQQSIDWMLGHILKKPVAKAEFKPDPEFIRLEYGQAMETVMIINKVQIVKVTEAKVDAMEKEMKSLRQNNEYLMENYDKMRKELNKYINYYEKGSTTYTASSEPDLKNDKDPEKLSKKEKYITY